MANVTVRKNTVYLPSRLSSTSAIRAEQSEAVQPREEQAHQASTPRNFCAPDHSSLPTTLAMPVPDNTEQRMNILHSIANTTDVATRALSKPISHHDCERNVLKLITQHDSRLWSDRRGDNEVVLRTRICKFECKP